MWPDVTLILREFARRPPLDLPGQIDPGREIAWLRLAPWSPASAARRGGWDLLDLVTPRLR